MPSLIGILLDVSYSMRHSIGEGTDKGGPWARSIFEVIDNLIKYDISSDNHVFAIGFGARCGEEVFDIIGTLKQIPNQDNVAEGPATTEHINEIFDVLEEAGAVRVRKWAEVEVVKKALTDNLAVVFLNNSDQPFLKEFVEKILPPACRDWPKPGVGLYLGAVYAAALIWPPAVIPTVLALKYGPEVGNVYLSWVTRYRRATVEEVKEVVEKAKAYLLKKIDAEEVKEVVEKAKAHSLKKVDTDSIFKVQAATDVVQRCVDAKNLTEEKSRELLQRIEPYIYGRTPFFRAIGEAIALFHDPRFSSHKKLLFILSDGVPTDGQTTDRAGVDHEISKFTEADVSVVSCFISKSARIEPKRLFSKMEPDWDPAAKLMFSLSSKFSTQSLPRTMFVERDWTIDHTNNETHLFLQLNHPDNMREICEVARNVVCCQFALSGFLASVALDLHINQEVKCYKAKRKQGASCCVNAAATVLHLSMKRILGREGGYPNFYKIKEDIINRFESNRANTILVLQTMCPKYRLHCKEVNLEGAMKAVTSSRPVVATFRLTGNEWDRFKEFYKINPKGILTKKDIGITARPPKTGCYMSSVGSGSLRGRAINPRLVSHLEQCSPPKTPDFGHAVVLTSFDSGCLRLLNSWGENWADMGFFRVQNADVLGLQFIDVYWTEEDLTEKEKSYYVQHGSEVAKNLMNEFPGLTRAEFKCPRCSEISPVMEFTGTLSRAECPKCGDVFSAMNDQEGNILALNIYLTSLKTFLCVIL